MKLGRISEHRRKLEKLKGRRSALRSLMKENKDRIELLEKRKVNLENARVIIQQVAQATQKELEFHIAELVSLALSSVFDDPYSFKLDFVVRRGKTEADFKFISPDSGEVVDPMDSTGGGVVDITAFALRVGCWNLQRPRSRNTLFLDEPFKFLSRDLQPKASEMLKQISQRLKLQMIIVTHEPRLLESADRVFKVTKEKGISQVEET